MRPVLVVGVMIFIWGCSSAPPLDMVVPQNFDLNGQWLLNPVLSDRPPNTRRLTDSADRSRRASRRPPRGSSLAFITHDFPVLGAQSMVIEQNRDSMGVRFDKGEYRDVSWGERKRGLWEVSAGWYEGDLVILSESNDAKARETISLSANGQTMVVFVVVESDGEDFTSTRTFERVPSGR